jgi:membrane-associated phospholipid phosphatase
VFVSTRRTPDSYFLMPPAAMPSLHIAHAAFFVWMLRRISRGLSLLALPLLLWFMITAVGLAWHYLLDLPAGFLLAAIAVALVTRMLPDPQTMAFSPPLPAESVVVEEDSIEELIPA